jgi:hypothetical protein
MKIAPFQLINSDKAIDDLLLSLPLHLRFNLEWNAYAPSPASIAIGNKQP